MDDFLQTAKLAPAPEGLAWTPLQEGRGANFKTRQLKEMRDGSLRVASSSGGVLFDALFGALGFVSGCAGYGVLWWAAKKDPHFLIFLVGGVFSLICVVFIWVFFYSRVQAFREASWFDCTDRICHRLRKGDRRLDVPFSDVRGIQVLANQNLTVVGNFVSYQLNLVLADGQRMNVMEHGDLGSIQSDAKWVAKLVGVPVWKKIQVFPNDPGNGLDQVRGRGRRYTPF